jgi:NitT/TauT family transport system ATP-binding protein
MTRTEIEQLVRRDYAARVAGNIEAIVSLMAPDVHFALAGDPMASPVPGQLRGIDKLRPQVAQLIQAFKFNSYDIVALVGGIDRRRPRQSKYHIRDHRCQGRPRRFVRPVLRHSARCEAFDQAVTGAAGMGAAAAGASGAPSVSLAGVTIAFRLAGNAVYSAVQDASLAVGAAEFVAIVGPTGCGKSTLLNVAAGLLAPASGRVEIFGAPLVGLNSDAGYLFQSDALFPWKTALENVAIGLEIAGVPGAEARARAQQWMGRVGLAGFGARYPHMLSGGQRKRVGLAQVLIRDPRILLMDEPFGPLDAQTRQIMGNLLLDLWSADRKAVLFVTHDLEEAIALSDRVLIMSASPAARIIGDWKVPLPRPRDIADVKLEKAFQELHREIWAVLKEEVLKGYAQTDAASTGT